MLTELQQANHDLNEYIKQFRNGMHHLSDKIAKKHGMYGKPFSMVVSEIKLFIRELENEMD